MRKFCTAVAATTMLLAGCSKSDPVPPQPTETVTVEPTTPEPSIEPEIAEQIYFDLVRDEIPVLENTSNTELREQGHLICNYFEVAGVSQQSIMDAVSSFVDNSQVDLSVGDAGFFFGAATATYCPDINEQISDAAPNLGGSTA